PADFIYVWGGNHTLTVIDGNTNTVKRTATTSYLAGPLGANSVVELGQSKWAYVADALANQVHVIDLTTLADVVDITVAGAENLAVNPAAHRVYVTANGSAEQVTVIDTDTNTVVNVFSVTGKYTYALSVDPVRNLLYVLTYPTGVYTRAAITVLDATT